ncbi:PH domain-containing protein [Flammeovirga pectinis]|nr:PH domain-containing protein [Flammeovirga pectinis]
MKFYSKFDKYSALFWFGMISFLLLIMYLMLTDNTNEFVSQVISFGIVLPIILLFAWVISSTYYEVKSDQNEFKYRSGPIRGKISIKDIKKVKLNTRVWSGLKLGLSFKKGMTLYYNKYDEIYITPKQSDDLCRMLKELNSEIKIIS